MEVQQEWQQLAVVTTRKACTTHRLMLQSTKYLALQMNTKQMGNNSSRCTVTHYRSIAAIKRTDVTIKQPRETKQYSTPCTKNVHMFTLLYFQQTLPNFNKLSSPMGQNDSWPTSPQSLFGLGNVQGLRGLVSLEGSARERVCIGVGGLVQGASLLGFQRGAFLVGGLAQRCLFKLVSWQFEGSIPHVMGSHFPPTHLIW